MAEEAMTRKERDRRRREDDFLNAAEKLYAERGYFQTSMEDVAQAAEYATGTIYRYFSSKEELYHSLLIRKGHVFFERITKILSEFETPMDKLQAIVRNKVTFFIENAEFMRIYMNVVNAPCDTMNPPEGLKDVHEQYMNMVADIFRDGMKQGVFVEMDVEMLLLAFVGLSNNLLCNMISNEKSITKEDAEGFIMSFLENGLIAKKGRK